MVNKKSSPTLLRVHEVDFGSKVPIDNDKPKTFCASQIFGSCRSAARLLYIMCYNIRVYRTEMVGKSIYSLLTMSLLKEKDC
jgi:hypothetical protein